MLKALYKKKKDKRYQIFIYVLVGISISIIARLAYLQIIEGDFYNSRSEGNSLRVIPMTAARGIIYDRNGKVLAGSRPAFTVSLMPNGKMPEKELMQRLSNVLGIPLKTIEEKISKKKDGYEPIRIATDIEMNVITTIEEHKAEFPGITIEVEPIRYYPNNESAAQTLGYVGEVTEEELAEEKAKNPNKTLSLGSIKGRAGLERIYDKYLRGHDGGRQVEVDASGRPVAERDSKKTIPGQDIHLTIDEDLQKAAERAVLSQLDWLHTFKIPATAASVIAMDPNTGAILAMVSYPAYNPNSFAIGLTDSEWNSLMNDPRHPFDNRVISGQYPPGSPFKIITATAALETKKVTTTEKIFDSGQHWLIDKRNAQGEAFGWLDIYEAIAKSDNVYFYELGRRLGIDNIEKYARIYGLGQKTGVKLYGEAEGNVASEAYKRKVFDQDWYLGETFDAAIGQSFNLVTPIQMAVMFSEIANGGIKYKPYLVSRIDNLDGTPKEIFGPEQVGTLQVSNSVMNVIRESLKNVAEEGGTAGELFKNFPINVAGKTGTAENAHGYDDGWFVAYAPYDKPRIVVVTLVEQGSFGAMSAAPIAKAVLEEFFHVEDKLPETKNDKPTIDKIKPREKIVPKPIGPKNI